MAKIRDKQPDADAGRVKVDEQLEGLEARLTSIYTQAGKELENDLSNFLDNYNKEDTEKRSQVESGEMTEKDYSDWRERQVFRSDAMQAKIDDLSTRLVNVDQQAMSMVNNQLPETYATSYNFGGYRAETQANAAGFDYTQFTIINQDAVRVLATEDPDLIPWQADPDVEEDKKWNRQHVQEAVQQGLVKGDSMDDVAKRLLPVVNMDKNAAIRTARTAVNGVENKGRKDATERVKEAGVPMVETWSCTHDDRTRDTHIMLDGTTADDNGMFGKGILSKLMAYPGDPAGDPAEVYNCRCALVSSIKGIDHSKDDELYAKMMEEEYFDDWVQVKESIQAKEDAFQSKKEGASERVAEKMAKAEETTEPDLSKFGLEEVKDFDAEEFNYIDTRYGKYQYELAQEMEDFTDEDMLFVKIDDGKHAAYAAVDPETNSLEGIVSTGGGQGTELLGRVMEYQESQGEGLMWLADNPDSVSYYEHLGLGEYGKGDKNEKLYEISAEDMSKALEKVNEHRDIPEENVEEITAEQFKQSASKNLTIDEQEELYNEFDKYLNSVSGETERFADLLDKMEDAKWDSPEPVYRGIGVPENTYEELLKSYENGENVTMRSLSWTSDKDVAEYFAKYKGEKQIVYVDTTEGKKDMISIRDLTEERLSKWVADNTKEVVSTDIDMQFKPYKIVKDGNIAYVYVKEIKKGK